MKQCLISYIKRRNPKKSPFKLPCLYKKEKGNLYGLGTVTCKAISLNHQCKIGLTIALIKNGATLRT
jgi:hypothetical protein